LEDTIKAISLPEPLHEDESKDELILYQTATLELNNLAELPVKDIEQLLTPSRMVSLDLLELNTAL
jgi:hypothetical protein